MVARADDGRRRVNSLVEDGALILEVGVQQRTRYTRLFSNHAKVHGIKPMTREQPQTDLANLAFSLLMIDGLVCHRGILYQKA